MADAPSEVIVHCTANGEPFAGAYVLVWLPMWSKNQYMLVFGPTDEQGLLRITGAELSERARAELDLFPMDYASFPQQWSGGIGAAALSLEDVARLREAMKLWGNDLYPPHLSEGLDIYERKLREGLDVRADVARTA